ncbi:MAG: ABC transporter substrate-binding protein [Patescibacteria group bacterium]
MFKFLKNFFIEIKRREINLFKIIKSHLEWDKKLIEKLFSKKEGEQKLPNLKQLTYLPFLLNKKEKIKIVIFSGLIIICLIFLLFRIYLRLPLKPVSGGQYTEGIVGELSSINPIVLENDVNLDLSRLIFSSLVKWKNTQIVPDLAKSWQKEEGGKKYIFNLRENVFWHDGKKFSADDVIFTIEMIKNEKINSHFRKGLANIKVKKINDHQLEFSLEQPFSPFLTLLVFGIIPKHLWEKVSVENFSSSKLNISPIGTGPFKLKDLVKDENGKIKTIVLEKNKKYYLDGPYLEKINLKFFENPEEALIALQKKKIDGLALSTIENGGNLPKFINSYKLTLSSYTAIFLNQKDKILTKKIREALALSIDKKKIVEELKNVKELNTAIVHPNFKGKVKEYTYDPILASQKIKKEGYQKRGRWFTDKKGKVLEINLVVLDLPRYKKVGEMIKNFWEEIGLKVNLKVLEKSNFEKAVKEKKYSALLYSIIEGYDPDPFPLWHSSQIEKGLNLANFKDIRLDSLLEKARMSFDESERKKYYQEFQELISKEIPAIFLYQLNFEYLVDQKIKGINSIYTPFLSDRLANIEDWYIYLKRSLK